ncbi:MAG: hypothetical protein V3U13_03510 [Gemmatimonadota bacterium]
MAGGSGIHTVPADRASGLPLTRLQALVLVAVLAASSGCVYFNALYNANKIFDQGVKEFEEGRDSNGRILLEESIEKAERIVATKPNSRWADDALLLIVRARLLREDWAQAAEASRQLLGYAKTRADSARAAGYLGEAELNLGEPQLADSLLTVALSVEKNETRRAELLAYRGSARVELGYLEAADEDLRVVSELKPDWVPPRIDHVRLRLLIDDGQGAEAATEYAVLLTLPLKDREERQVVDLASYMAERDPAITIDALAEVQSSTVLPSNRAKLLKLRGDLKIALGDYSGGRADYFLTAALVPDSRGAAEARLTLVRMDLRNVSTIEGFDSLTAVLARVAAEPSGRRSADVRDLDETFIRLQYWLSTGGLGYLLAAETARDELEAPSLARRLFLEYADSQPQALWAPKAILAALDLTGVDSGDPGEGFPAEPSAAELRRRLLEDYQDSGYVQALFGEEGGRFTFEELEQGLQRQLERLQKLADQEVRNRRSGATQQTGG